MLTIIAVHRSMSLVRYCLLDTEYSVYNISAELAVYRVVHASTQYYCCFEVPGGRYRGEVLRLGLGGETPCKQYILRI